MVVAGHGSAREGLLARLGSRARGVTIGLGLAAALGITITLLRMPHELDEDRAALYEVTQRDDVRNDLTPLLRDALARHPAEPYLPFVGSVVTGRRGHSVVPWIERTLTLAPVYGPAHFVLAEQLAARSPSQARLEYRLAITQAPFSPLVAQAIARGSKLISTYDDAQELLPATTVQRDNMLEQLAEQLHDRLPSTSARFDELQVRMNPAAVNPLARSIDDVLADVAAGPAAPWCDGEYSCVATGLERAERLRYLQPGSCEALVKKARLLIAANRAADGLQQLRDGAEAAANAGECWRGMGTLALEARNDVYLDIAVGQLAVSGCDSDAECANNLLWIANVEAQRGNGRKAVGYLQRAHDRAPERTDIVEHWGELATALGMHAAAMQAYQDMERLSKDPKWAAAAEHERSAVMRDQVTQ
jgi:tetratricopeptide (TPR) repeat protein